VGGQVFTKKKNMQKNTKRIWSSLLKRGKSKKKTSLLSLLALATITSGVFIYTVVFAVPAITTASGGTGISIDTTSASTGSGTYTTLGPIIITEPTRKDIAAGQHTFTLPTGWEFDTSSTIGRGSNGGESGIDFVFTAAPIPGANSFSIWIEWYDNGFTEPAVISFSNLRVRPTGTTPSPAANITHTAGTIVDVVNGTTNFGTLSSVPGTATHLKVTVDDAAPGAGVTTNATVRAYDQFDNLAESYTGSKNLTFYFNDSEVAAAHQSPNSADPTANSVNLGVSSAVTFTDGISASVPIVAVKKETPVASVDIDVVDTDTTSINSTGDVAYDAAITVQPGVFNTFVVGLSGSAIAGQATTTVFYAYDAYQNQTTKDEDGSDFTATESITFTTDGTASPNGTAPTYDGNDLTDGEIVDVDLTTGAFASADIIFYDSSETPTLTATHSTKSAASSAITVGASIFTGYTVTTENTGTENVDTAFSVTVTPVDVYENTQTTGATTDQVDFTSTAAVAPDTTTTATIPASAVLNLASGAQVVAGFQLVNATETPTITATNNAVGATNGTSDVITVNSGAATDLVITGSPTMTAGGTNALTITAIDQFANTAASYDGAKNLTFSGLAAAPIGTIPNVDGTDFASATLVTFSSGVASAALSAFKAEGVVQVEVTDGGIDSGVGDDANDLDLTVSSAIIDHFTVTGITDPVTAGTTVSPVVTALDIHNNTKTDYTGTITFASTDAHGSLVLPAPYAFVGGDNGVHTFTGEVTLVTSGEQTVTVTGDTKTGTQIDITVSADTATVVRVEDANDGSGSVVGAQQFAPGDTLIVYAITRDTYGNFVANEDADSWTVTGSIGTLSDATGLTTTLTATTGGTGEIQVTESGLTPTNSGTITVASLTTIYVDDDGSGNDSNSGNAADNAKLTIQAAVNAVADGGTVNVAAGTYAQDIYINKSLALTGDIVTPANVIIKGQTTELNSNFPNAGIIGSSIAAVEINADNVQVQGFTIETPNLTDLNYAFGILLDGTDIEVNNNVFNMKSDGGGIVDPINDRGPVAIQTWTSANGGTDTKGLNIHNNIFQEDSVNKLRKNGYYGIYLNVPTDEDASANRISIANNNFSGRIWRAITTEHSYVDIEDNTISTTNDLTWDTNAGYGKGITLHQWAPDTTIDSVTIEGNTISGAVGGQGFQYGVIIGNTGSAMTFTNVNIGDTGENNGNTISDAKLGVLIADLATASGVSVNYNDINTAQDDSGDGATWTTNEYGDFSNVSNTSYPTAYLVSGSKGSVDATPVGKLDGTSNTIVATPVSVVVDDEVAGAATITITVKGNNSDNLLAGINTGLFVISSNNASSTISPVTDAGAGVYTATIYSLLAGNDIISVTIDSIPITATAALEFLPEVVNRSALTVQPENGATAGEVFDPQPQVTLYDEFDNILTNDDATTVTLSAVDSADTASPAETILSGTVVMAVTDGVATFTDISYTKVDSIQLKAVTGVADIFSDTIQNVPDILESFSLVNFGTLTAGTAATTVVTALDAYGNTTTNGGTLGSESITITTSASVAPDLTVPTYNGVDMTGAGASATLDLTTGTVTSADVIFYKASETPTLTITLNAKSGTATTVAVDSASIAALSITGDSPVTTAQTSNITVTGTDQYENPVTDTGTVVTFAAGGGGNLASGGDTLDGGTFATTLTKDTPGASTVTVNSTGLTPGNITITFTDGTAPGVSNWTPGGVSNASVDTQPTVTFSEAMKESTLNSTNIILKKYSDGSTVTSTLSTTATTAIITPTSALDHGTKYYIYLDGTTDELDNALAGWDDGQAAKDTHSFTTEAAEIIAPTVSSYSPIVGTTDVEVDAGQTPTYGVWLKFSEALDPTTITSSNIQLRYFSDGDTWSANDAVIDIIRSKEEGNSKVVFQMGTPLEYGTQYYFYIGTGVKDVAGNPFTANTWQQDQKDQHTFTTKKDLIVDSYVLEKGDAVIGDFSDGWRYRFDVTTNNATETNLKAKFTDWVESGGGAGIEVTGNAYMLIDQSSGGAISTLGGFTNTLITSGSGTIKSYAVGNEYTDQVTAASIAGLDNNGSQDGNQVTFYVFFRIPAETLNGSYSTSYGILTSTP